jgi:hypothetical protein
MTFALKDISWHLIKQNATFGIFLRWYFILFAQNCIYDIKSKMAFVENGIGTKWNLLKMALVQNDICSK